MRISDWSSDVCSSDLRELADLRERDATGELDGDASGELTEHQLAGLREPGQVVHAQDGDVVLVPTAAQVCQHRGVLGVLDQIGRASCREECVSTCRSRRPPYHSKKKPEE